MSTIELRPRVIALGVLVWRDHLLLQPANAAGDAPTWRCLGGGVEYGERAADAIVREFLEETSRRVEVVEALPVIENIFEVRGEVGHEAVFPFVVRWTPEDEPPNLEALACMEDGVGAFEACWMPLAEVLGGGHTIYPDGFTSALGEWLVR